MTPDPTVTAVSDGALTEMRDRFRESARPDKRQYAELFDELLRARSALAWAAGELTLRELVRGAMALIEGPTLLTEDNCDEWLRRARSALADVGELGMSELEPLHREALERIEPVPHIATLINNNQPGWTNIIETAPNVTIDVGTKLYDQKALFAVGVAMLEEGRKGGYEDGYIVGKAFQKHFADKDANGITGEHAAAGMSKGTGKQPRPAEQETEVSQRVAQQIIRVRAALIVDDNAEANHQLYKIAAPNFDSLTPWDKLEALAGFTTDSLLDEALAAKQAEQPRPAAPVLVIDDAPYNQKYSPAAHTAQLTEADKAALLAGAECLEQKGRHVPTAYGVLNMGAQYGATLRRLAEQGSAKP